MRFWIPSLLLMTCIGCTSRPTRIATAPPADVPRVSVMTYNVNFGIAGDWDTMSVVDKHDADVVFFQETNAAWADAIRRRFQTKYPHASFHLADAYAGGSGVISKWPIESVEVLPKVNFFPAVRVVLNSPIGRLQVLNVHLRPPIGDDGSVVSGYFQTPPIRRAEIETFAAALDPTLPTLIVGDFNESEDGRAVRWLEKNGYRSGLPEFAPGAKTWRWPTSVGVTLRGRYDHLCYNDRLHPLNVYYDNAGWSDHLPVVGVFTLSTQ